MSNQLSILAPAKINLFLHVVGQRPDGYHLLQSVFQLINLSDQVILNSRQDSEIHRINPLANVAAKDDLVVKAAVLLQKTCGVSQGVDIDLEKNIPMGAGLGGGSSDAASTLLGLNQLWNLNLSKWDLMDIGIQLGADVPFFIQGHNAFVEGIGEIITPIDLPIHEYAVVYPGVSIPTKEIFSSPELTRNHSQITITDFAEQKSNLTMFQNDLQEIAEQKYVAVKNAIEWLKCTFPNTQPIMSGSGSSVFCKIPDSFDTDSCISELPHEWKFFKVKSLMRHSAYNLIPNSNLSNKLLFSKPQQGSRQVG
ncbi:4-(cytidine 5'-diphospho)-2-C-methyl-D-erythritol kinase [Polynucleobacter rarus]|uniref:4-(cytidine 5'-diphospho)-2-C-methyl-D-erythritol kinase n=1 Tax=Polynucleobacter rarus TaxID=556055 RepID=UPI000D3E3DDD|nr:4-(cytidine 5'-diphospho)-2-C-methyl-D-erythritol kinase [Polynucleobacter rarus]